MFALLILDADKRHIQYISRVMCAAPLSKSPDKWNGPVSRSLLAFNSMVMEVSRNLRNLVEMVLLAMCTHGDVERLGYTPNDFTNVAMRYSLIIVLVMLTIGFRLQKS